MSEPYVPTMEYDMIRKGLNGVLQHTALCSFAFFPFLFSLRGKLKCLSSVSQSLSQSVNII